MTGDPQKFAELSAQTIPVLILALLADPTGRKNAGRAGLLLFALVAGVAGEVVALLSVRSGSAAWGDVIIGSAMAIMTFAILKPHFIQYYATWLSPLPGHWRYAVKALFIGIYFYGYIGFLVFFTTDRTQRVAIAGFIIGVGTFLARVVYEFRRIKQCSREAIVGKPQQSLAGANASGRD